MRLDGQRYVRGIMPHSSISPRFIDPLDVVTPQKGSTMWIGKYSFLPFLLVIVTACGQSESQNVSAGHDTKGWTAATIRAEQLSCESSFEKANPGAPKGAKSYCACMIGKITSKWTPIEVVGSLENMQASLTSDGSVAECTKVAALAQLKDTVSENASGVGMPDGFLGVALLTSTADLASIRPNVRRTPHGWTESAEWKGGRFEVFYKPGDGENNIQAILLQRASDRTSYMQMQERLSEAYDIGSPQPSAEGMLLHAKVSGGGVVLLHNLIQSPGGGLVEQVMLYYEG